MASAAATAAATTTTVKRRARQRCRPQRLVVAVLLALARLPTAVAQAGGADASVVLDAYDKRLPGFNVHIPPPGVPANASLLGLSTPPSNSSMGDWGNGVCKKGLWQEAPNAALENGAVLPLVQCWRNPPCVRWNYATPQRCKAWPKDSDWPTADPYLPSDPPGQHTMKELLDTYWKDKTVVLVGDSIGNLIYYGAVCEAAKAYDVTVDVHAGAAAGNELHSRLAAFHHKMNDLRNKDAHMGGQYWLGGPPFMPEAVLQSGTLLVRKGWHMWKESDMEGIISFADVIVVNYGLHYGGNLTEFEEAMPRMFKQLDAFASQPGKAVLFRETGAEHKNVDENTPEGDFLPTELNHPDPAKVRGCQCKMRPPDDPGLGPRLNDFIANLAKSHPRIGLVPFYDLTLPRYDLHEAGFCAFEGLRGKPPDKPPPYCCDCTHFCYTPQLWKAFFHNVFLAHSKVDAADAVGAGR